MYWNPMLVLLHEIVERARSSRDMGCRYSVFLYAWVCTVKRYVRSKDVYAQRVCTLRGCVRVEGVYAQRMCTLKGCVRLEGVYA